MGFPTVGGDRDAWGVEMNALLEAEHNADGTHKFKDWIVLGVDYNVLTTNTAAVNAAAIQQAWIDSKGLIPIRHKPGRFPCNPLTLPAYPLLWYGDGKAKCVLKFPQSITSMLTYDPTSTGKIPSSSPFYSTGSDGKKSNYNHSWKIRGMGFEGGDWSGSAGSAGFYFPNWSSGDRNSLKLELEDVGIGLFNGPGIFYEINGLYGDSNFTDVDVFANADVGVIPGSDQRWKNLLSHDNGKWGIQPADNRNTQIDGGKSYGNGQIDHSCGGYFSRGMMSISNHYAQDNAGPAYWFEGKMGAGSNLMADRNCTNGTDHSGLVANNVDGLVIEGYRATDTQRTNCQTHGVKVTGTNSHSRITGSQIQTNAALGTFVESNSGGVTVVEL